MKGERGHVYRTPAANQGIETACCFDFGPWMRIGSDRKWPVLEIH